MGNISIWQLLIVLAIVIMLFGTKRLRGMGSDLGEAIKGFKKSVSDEDKHEDPKKIDAEAAESESADTAKSDDKTKSH
ncbi:twin-arginine translocase TatA/TatE family subunit [Gilvimarinus sp. DA14]|uniref:twin-arginine translocase TatA/TatE family subunit n=1 Tax=Gilvimarinus sp. DA14 TaxID=2956798 RepID=UPI0020B80F57|nr:twin-arginine translocase TatA/TatE family subunit [Gilvimarinus sp. DA14]UTF59539.1 twin-arginine translocase TatA/TatE family subunit [Gilvimarinus sp. DA14]